MRVSLEIRGIRRRLDEYVRDGTGVAWPASSQTAHRGVPGTPVSEDRQEDPPESVEGLETRAQRQGCDVLAWYQPFHHYTPSWWGIYILSEGIEIVAQLIERDADGELEPGVADDQARGFLFRHEFFHHVVESAAGIGQLGLDRAPEDAVKELESVWGNLGHSPPIYSMGGTIDPVEEALANAYAFQGVDKDLRGELREWLRHQPEGYCDFQDYLGEAFYAGCQELWDRMAPGYEFSSPLLGGEIPSIRNVLHLVGDDHVPVRLLGLSTQDPGSLHRITTIPEDQVRKSDGFQEAINELDGSVRPQVEKRVNLLIEHMKFRGENVFRGHQGTVYYARAGDYRIEVKRNPESGSWVFRDIEHRKTIYR